MTADKPWHDVYRNSDHPPTLEDLNFKPHPSRMPDSFQALLILENGYEVSVLYGEGEASWALHGDGIDTWEVAVLKDGSFVRLYDEMVDDVLAYQTREEVNDILKRAWEIDNLTKLVNQCQ